MIFIKSEYDISQIKIASNIWKMVRDAIIKEASINTNLLKLEQLAKKIITENNAIPAFKGYGGFKGEICISVNDCIIHGVPSDYNIKKGDIISFDVGVNYNNYICDAAFTICFDCDEETIKMNKVCYDSLDEVCKIIKPNIRVGDISNFIQEYVESRGYHILKDFGGHGCGIKLHEDPIILNYGKKSSGSKLLPGMIICIEPMIMIGSDEYYIDEDKWSVKSVNKKNNSHWEHMILITDDGCEVLTK